MVAMATAVTIATQLHEGFADIAVFLHAFFELPLDVLQAGRQLFVVVQSCLEAFSTTEVLECKSSSFV